MAAAAVLAAALASVIGTAPDARLSRIDRFVAAEMRRARIPGMAVAVVKDGRLLVAKGYGLANVEHQVPVTRRTVFQSGSMAKQFAATAVMTLVAEGKLSLDDSIDRFFVPAPESWKRITVRHLLSHTSGLGDYPDSYDLRRDYTEDELMTVVKASPLAFAPGERWSYSNLGYVTLGVLIHKATGQFYGDYLAERIFKPLGMTSARVISEADIVPHRAAGYRLVAGELKNQAWVSPSVNTTADGSLYLSLDDMLKWEAALASGQPIGADRLAQMWSAARLLDGSSAPYGFGWFTVVRHGRRIVFHGGAWQGFKGFSARFPDDRLTVIVLANLWDANEWRVTRTLASAFIPELAPGLPEPIPDTEPAVAALARKALRQIAAGSPDPALFTPEAGAQLTPERVSALRAQIEALALPAAQIAALELVGRSEGQGGRTYRYALADLTATEVLTLRLAADGKIASIELRALAAAPPGR